MFALCRMLSTLQWRNNGYSGILNHQPHDWLFNCSFRRRSKKTSKPRVTGLCAGNSQHKWPGTQKMFPFDDIIMSFWFGNHTWPKFVHRMWVIGENVANVFYCLKWQSLVFLLCYAFLHWEIYNYIFSDRQTVILIFLKLFWQDYFETYFIWCKVMNLFIHQLLSIRSPPMIYVSLDWVIIGLDNGLWPLQHKAII